MRWGDVQPATLPGFPMRRLCLDEVRKLAPAKTIQAQRSVLGVHRDFPMLQGDRADDGVELAPVGAA